MCSCLLHAHNGLGGFWFLPGPGSSGSSGILMYFLVMLAEFYYSLGDLLDMNKRRYFGGLNWICYSTD